MSQQRQDRARQGAVGRFCSTALGTQQHSLLNPHGPLLLIIPDGLTTLAMFKFRQQSQYLQRQQFKSQNFDAIIASLLETIQRDHCRIVPGGIGIELFRTGIQQLGNI
ncbi:MAG: hypothetical protein R3C12_10180 [Planctomycetaceae bacterium]